MDIPDEKRNEFKQMKDRINNYDDSAKERIIAICRTFKNFCIKNILIKKIMFARKAYFF